MIELTLAETLVFAASGLALGILMLVRGGNWMIDAAVYIANHFGISPLLIGFTIVAFGTSLPELVVSVNANLSGLPGIAVGNVIGSNIANILMIIGATAVVSVIVVENPQSLRHDLAAMLLAAAALAVLLLTDGLTRIAGAAMILSLTAYTFWQYWSATHDPEEGGDHRKFKSLPHSFLFLVAGLAFIILGAEFLVRGAKVSAEIIGVPDAVIGLTVIALGTSLPELTTCIVAAMKRQNGLVIGNIVGSNVFNILMIIGLAVLVRPIPASSLAPQMVSVDLWVMAAVSALFALILLTRGRIGRMTGILFMCAYAGYIISVYALGLSNPQG